MTTRPLRGVLAGLLVALLTAATAAVGAAPAAAQPAARWIWAADSRADQYVVARRTFRLDAAPTAATLRIAVDSKYRLYVNGTLVVVDGGLKRGPTPTGTYQDAVDVRPHLRAGDNTIALLATYFGKQGFSHNDSGRGGLLAELDATVGGAAVSLVTDGQWKLREHAGFSPDTSDPRPNYRLAESNVRYDARADAELRGWQEPGYDDSAWPAATDLGPGGAAPWGTLTARPIPLFRFGGLVEYTNAAALPGRGTGGTISATLPSNIHVSPYLRVRAAAGRSIDIRTDHYTDGGEPTLRATYVTRDGDQEFEVPGWLSGTAVEYTVPDGVEIVALRYRESGYDTDFAGSFSSSDPELDTLWRKAARSTYLNMRDTYMDCPTRERAQWWGDVVNNVKQSFYVFDVRSHALARKAIQELVAWRRPDGVLYSPVPEGNWEAELPVQSLASVASFWSYYEHTGDAATVVAAYPAVRDYLRLWEIGADGLVRHRAGGWDWQDWGTNIDVPLVENAWYHLALDTAVKLAELSGNGGDVAGWQERRRTISTAYDAFWRPAAGEYRSPGYGGDTDDRGNALAVVAGLAGPDRYPALTRVLQRHRNASPYMEFTVLEALYRMGSAAEALDRMRSRYADMIRDPAPTLWELWERVPQGTDDHGWSGGPLFALSAYGAGARPTSPAWATYEVTPQLGGLTRLATATPTVKGEVRVAVERTDAGLTLDLTSPAGTTARVTVPAEGLTARTVSVGGTEVFADGRATGSVPGVTVVGSSPEGVVLDVAPGARSIRQTGTPATDLDLAAGRPVSASSSLEAGPWGRARLTDGVTAGAAGNSGFTTDPPASSADVSRAPARVSVDLGSVRRVGSVTLHPRTDTPAVGGGAPGFPADFAVEVSGDGSSWSTVRSVVGEPAPGGARSYAFSPVDARFVRVSVSRLGTPAADEPAFFRLQLTELQVRPPQAALPGNAAAGRPVSASSSLEAGPWGRARLTDGVTAGAAGNSGFTTDPPAPSADVSGAPARVSVDLGSARRVGSVTLHPRTDTAAVGGGTAGFPVDFAVEVSPDGSSWSTVRSVVGEPAPDGARSYAFPPVDARFVRVSVSRSGTPAADEPAFFRLQLTELQVTG